MCVKCKLIACVGATPKDCAGCGSKNHLNKIPPMLLMDLGKETEVDCAPASKMHIIVAMGGIRRI